LLLVLASAVIPRSESHGTHYHIVAVPSKSPRKVHQNPEDLTEGERTVRLFGTNSPKKEAV
jgi:hypothetical protein